LSFRRRLSCYGYLHFSFLDFSSVFPGQTKPALTRPVRYSARLSLPRYRLSSRRRVFRDPSR
jgi:hypothetical protein